LASRSKLEVERAPFWGILRFIALLCSLTRTLPLRCRGWLGGCMGGHNRGFAAWWSAGGSARGPRAAAAAPPPPAAGQRSRRRHAQTAPPA
jgi:hypothetical protein